MFNEVVAKREELINHVQTLVEQGEQATEQLNKRKEERKAELLAQTKRNEVELTKIRQENSVMEQKSN